HQRIGEADDCLRRPHQHDGPGEAKQRPPPHLERCARVRSSGVGHGESILTRRSRPCEEQTSMNRFETECRRLIDGLARELAALAGELAQTEIRRAREIQAKTERAALKKERATPKVSPRLALALERGEERRRLAAERRAQKLALRAARRTAVAEGQPGPASGRGRARPAVAPAPLLPPPLFVHKRSRDGSIQKLERAPGDEAPVVAVPV